MRKTFLTVAIVFIAQWAVSANLTEDFESGLPNSASGSETTVTLTSGTWTIKDVAGKTNNGSTRASFLSANSYLITPALNFPTSISFRHRGSGNNKKLTVEKSIDNGSNWTEIGVATVSSSSTYGSSSFSINETGTQGVLVRLTCTSATIYIDDVNITLSTMASEPTTQASIATSGISGSSMIINFTKGNGDGRLLVYQKDSAITWTPTDGTSYTGDFPKTLTSTVTAVSSNDETSAFVTGLQPGETYYFAVFEYNGSNADRNYLLPAGTCSVQTLTSPTITLGSNSVSFSKVKVGNSQTRTFNISAKYLETTNTVTLSSDNAAILLSTNGSTFTQSLQLTVTSGILAQTTITVQFKPTAYQEYSATVSAFAETVSASLTVTGIGSDTENYEYYISPSGNDDTGDGSIDKPWYNLQKAVNAAKAGDVIICRGGTYSPTTADSSGKTTIRIKTSGTADAMITIRNYDGETPIFDFAATQLIADGSMIGVRGFEITGDYWHLYGLTITHAGDNGIKLEGNHNKIERCIFCYNLDTGLQLGFGHDFSASGFGSSNDGSHCAYNDIIDCDSYNNCDCDANYGSDADGFACKMHNGIGNRFIRCRAWRNSDDAWDLYETDYSVTLIECWAWESGNADDHLWVKDYISTSHGFSGNGNGIKLGGNGTGGNSKGVHYAYNCVVFGCDKTGSCKGFDCNSHKGGHVIIGGLAFDNGYDFMFESGGGANSEFYNNVCMGKQEILVGTNSNNAYSGRVEPGETFDTNLVTNFSKDDYISLSEEDAKAPRGTDGSLPTNFARLKTGSKLVDAGLTKPVPYTDEFPYLFQTIYGSARDLGPYELKEGGITSDFQQIFSTDIHNSMSLLKNPVSTEAIVKFSTATNGRAILHICNLNGQIMETAYNADVQKGIDYYIPVDVNNYNEGIYICILSMGSSVETQKMVVVK